MINYGSLSFTSKIFSSKKLVMFSSSENIGLLSKLRLLLACISDESDNKIFFINHCLFTIAGIDSLSKTNTCFKVKNEYVNSVISYVFRNNAPCTIIKKFFISLLVWLAPPFDVLINYEATGVNFFYFIIYTFIHEAFSPKQWL